MVTICRNDFLEYVIPHLQRSRYFPDEMQHYDIRQFYRFLYKIHAKTPRIWNTEQRLFDAYGGENMDWRAIDRLTLLGMNCLANVMDAKVKNCSEVVVSSRQCACAACRTALHQRNFSTDALLLAYYEKRYVVGMLPHPSCQCEWCRCFLMPDGLTAPDPPGADLDFVAWARKRLRETRP